MQIVNLPLADLHPYENNPRDNDAAVKGVAESIRQFGFLVPIVVDSEKKIVAGHTRYKAAELLGLKEVPVVDASHLTEEEARKFRILDNKLGEIAQWNLLKLEEEFELIPDFNLAEFDLTEEDFFGKKRPTESIYTAKIKGPIYEPRGDRPSPSQLYDRTKLRSLLDSIAAADIPADVRDFLVFAAYRHVVFDYQAIAEFYAHADPEVQELMEDSALVIIDFEKAIEKGFTAMSEEIAAGYIEGSRKNDDDDE